MKKVSVNGLEYLEIEDEKGHKNYVNYYGNGIKRFEYINVCKEDDYKTDEEYFEVNKKSKILFFNDLGVPHDNVRIFIKPNKGDSLIIFETSINDINFLPAPCSMEYLMEEIKYRNHVINLGSNEVDDLLPNLLLNSASQDVLGHLKSYFPDKTFFLVKRWESYGDENKIIYDEIFKTGKKSDKFNDEDLTDFIGAELISKDREFFVNYDNIDDEDVDGSFYDRYEKLSNFYENFDPFEYDYLRIYEDDVFNALEINDGYLKLDVIKYNNKLKFIYL